MRVNQIPSSEIVSPTKVEPAVIAPAPKPKSRIPLDEILDEKRLRESIRTSEMAKAEKEIQDDVDGKLHRKFDFTEIQGRGHGFVTNEKDDFEEKLGYYGLALRERGNKQSDEIMLRIYNRWKQKRLKELQDRESSKRQDIEYGLKKEKNNAVEAQRLIEERRRIQSLAPEERAKHYGGEILTQQGEVRKKLQREIDALRSEPWEVVSARNDLRAVSDELSQLNHDFTRSDMVKLADAQQTALAEHAKDEREQARRIAELKMERLAVTKKFLEKATGHSFRGVAEPISANDYRLTIDSDGETYTIKYVFNSGKGRTKSMELFAGDYDRLSAYAGKLLPSLRDDMKQYWSGNEDGEENGARLPSIEWSEKARDKLIGDINEATLDETSEPSTADVYLIKTALNDTERMKGEKDEGSSTGAARLIKAMIGDGVTFKVSHEAHGTIKAELDQMDAAHVRLTQGTVDVSDLKLKDGNYYIHGNEFVQSDEKPKAVGITPKIHPTVEAVMEAGVLKKAVKDIAVQQDGGQITLTGAEKELILSGKGDVGTGRIAFGAYNSALLSINIEEEERASATYNSDYLNDILRNLPSDYKTVKLKFDKQKPLIVETENEKTGDKLKVFIAPRVE